MKLTQKVVDAISADSDGVTWDDETSGLGLRVQSRKKSWIVRYRVAGAQRQKSLPGGLSLKKARSRASEIRADAVRGVDTIAEGRAKAEADRRAAEAAKARALGKLIEKYLADAEGRLRPASYKVAKLYLNGEKHWRPLHDRPADALDRRDIMEVLERWAGRVTAAQTLYHLSACLSWGVEHHLIERNCAAGIKPPVKKEARERVLSDAEIRQLWAATDGDTEDQLEANYHRVLRLLLLTGQRRGEMGDISRDELDLERGIWSMPGARTKNGLPHEVPLSRQVNDILTAPELPEEGRLFGKNGFKSWARFKTKLDAKLAIPEWTPHDLRRTAVTHMAEIGIAPHIIEAIVNHVSGHKGGVAGVYNKAKYSQEKRAALQRWADHVEALAVGAKADATVVPMRRSQ